MNTIITISCVRVLNLSRKAHREEPDQRYDIFSCRISIARFKKLVELSCGMVFEPSKEVGRMSGTNMIFTLLKY